MVITVAANKGGVGKSTTAVHLAAYFGRSGPTALIDGDLNRSVTRWAQRGDLPFPVLSQAALMKRTGEFSNLVLDTPAQPTDDELRDLADNADLLVMPTEPDIMSMDALFGALGALSGRKNYVVLLTKCRPHPNKDAQEARTVLQSENVAQCDGQIPLLIAFQRAALRGVPVYKVNDPRASVAWAAYEAIGKEICGG